MFSKERTCIIQRKENKISQQKDRKLEDRILTEKSLSLKKKKNLSLDYQSNETVKYKHFSDMQMPKRHLFSQEAIRRCVPPKLVSTQRQ